MFVEMGQSPLLLYVLNVEAIDRVGTFYEVGSFSSCFVMKMFYLHASRGARVKRIFLSTFRMVMNLRLGLSLIFHHYCLIFVKFQEMPHLMEVCFLKNDELNTT